MSGRGHRRNHHRGRRGGGLSSFFEGRSSFLDRSRRRPLAAKPPGTPSSNEEVHSNDEIFREIEDYAIEAEREDRVQAGDPLYMCSHQTSSGRRE